LRNLSLNDFLQTDRGQPPQCSQEHRSDYASRQTALALQRGLEDAEDYQAFEATIIADYDAQSAVERELVLRLASLLWRLRRATTIETGLFEIQAGHLNGFRQARQVLRTSRDVVYAMLGRADSIRYDRDPASHRIPNPTEPVQAAEPNPIVPAVDPAVDLTRCFLRLANLPNFALDRLSRYEATLWRQAGKILFALDALDSPQTTGANAPFQVAKNMTGETRAGIARTSQPWAASSGPQLITMRYLLGLARGAAARPIQLHYNRIGIVSARLAEMILRDERAIIPIGSYQKKSALSERVTSGGIMRTWRGTANGRKLREYSGLSTQPDSAVIWAEVP